MDGKKLSEFKAFTGVSDDECALFYLKSCNFDLTQSVQKYFVNPNLFKGTNKPKPYSKKKKTNKGGFGTFSSLSNNEEKDDDPEYFAGGGKNSGVAIKGSKDDSKSDMSSNLLSKAREIARGGRGRGHGSDDNIKDKKKQKTDHWSSVGGGKKLGNTNFNPTSVPQGGMGGGSGGKGGGGKVPEEKTIKVVFFKNGFTIDGSELKSYDDPKEKKVLESFNNGFVPNEYSGGSKRVSVQLEDRKKDMYKPPPKVWKAFSGEGGMSLSGVQKIIPKSSSLGSFPTSKYSCDLSQPHTTIVIRLCDGTRLRMKFNLNDKVKVVKEAVRMSSKVGNDFDLMTIYPRKVLNLNTSIKEAGLNDSQIIQKLK